MIEVCTVSSCGCDLDKKNVKLKVIGCSGKERDLGVVDEKFVGGYRFGVLMIGNKVLVATDKDGLVGIRKYWTDDEADPRSKRHSELIYGKEFLPTH